MIKTWREVLDIPVEQKPLGYVENAMQAEIDELRAALEKAEMHIKHIGNDALRTENEQLRAALDGDALSIKCYQEQVADLSAELERANSSAAFYNTKYSDLFNQLAALKTQEPVAWMFWLYGITCVIHVLGVSSENGLTCGN